MLPVGKTHLPPMHANCALSWLETIDDNTKPLSKLLRNAELINRAEKHLSNEEVVSAIAQRLQKRESKL
jgi:hypothetical protein